MTASGLPRRLGLRLRPPSRTAPPTSARAVAKPIELAPAVAIARWMLLAVCGLSLWVIAFGLVFSGLQEHRTQQTLYAEFREKLANQQAPIGTDHSGHPIPTGEPVVMLNAPAAHISNLIVVEGTGAGELRSGPGHQRNTPLPGQAIPGYAGTTVLYGRSVTFGAPFAGIIDLRPGDEIWAVTGQGRFRYEVEDVRREGDPYPQPLPAGSSRLTLVTSDSSGSWWRGGWAPSKAVYVDAVMKQPTTAQPVPGQLPAQPGNEAPMASDTSSLIVLVFWLQALLIATVAVVWAWRRWGVWQTWIVGSVVLVALLWGVTNSAAVLLPNLV